MRPPVFRSSVPEMAPVVTISEAQKAPPCGCESASQAGVAHGGDHRPSPAEDHNLTVEATSARPPTLGKLSKDAQKKEHSRVSGTHDADRGSGEEVIHLRRVREE
jgi:hypothetical protein